MKVEHEDEFLGKKEDLTRKIAMQISEETGLKTQEVMKIGEFQFELLHEVIKCGRMESIRLPFIGIFEPNQYKLKKVTENAAFRRLKRQSDSESGS